VAQSLAVGPVFSATFIAALIAGTAGSRAPLAVVVGTLSVLAMAWVIVMYARRYAGAGAIYDYVRQATTPAWGQFAAGVYLIGAVLLGAGGIYLAVGPLAARALRDWAGIDLPWWILALLAAGVVFAVNHFGIKTTTRTQLTLSFLSVLPLVLLAGTVVVQGGASGNTLAVFTPALPPTGLFRGVLFAITLFIGFEASASLGEETADPHRSIPRAVVGTVVLSALFYLLIIYACTIGFGLDRTADWAADPSPLATLAGRYFGPWLASCLLVALLVDMLAVASAFTVTTSRGWFALARDGWMPAALARTAPRGTPVGANLLGLALASALILGVAASTIDVQRAFGITTAVGSLLIELVYIGLAAIVGGLLADQPRRWWRLPAILLALAAPAMAIYGSIAPFPEGPARLGIYGALAGVGLAGAWTLATAARGRTQPVGGRAGARGAAAGGVE
jgi:amino acid transporter